MFADTPPFEPETEVSPSQREQIHEQKAPVTTARKLYEQYKVIVKALVLADEAYRNACVNSDKENAGIEGNETIKRAALSITDTVFMRLYNDNPAFHNLLHQEIIEETYPVLSQPQ